jgi:hypothetical protein
MATETTFEDRKNAVVSWQRHYGMHPRSDSTLTVRYARGEFGDLHPSLVARELVATEYIYKTTLYGEVLEEFMRRVAERLRTLYHLSWTATWKIVQFYGPIACKLINLLMTGGRIPDRLAPQTSPPPPTP